MRFSSRTIRWLASAVVMSMYVGVPSPVTAAEAYFVLVFGSQTSPNKPNTSHSFATFVRLRGEGTDPSDYAVDMRTISWMPRNMTIRPHAVLPERGKNLELVETLEFAYQIHARVSLWGPYPIKPELFALAERKIAALSLGEIQYKSMDTGFSLESASNCFHAISSITNRPRLRIAKCGWGETASYYVLNELEPWILSKKKQDWLASMLGLDCFPLVYREWEHPESGALRGPLIRILREPSVVTAQTRAASSDLPVGGSSPSTSPSDSIDYATVPAIVPVRGLR